VKIEMNQNENQNYRFDKGPFKNGNRKGSGAAE